MFSSTQGTIPGKAILFGSPQPHTFYHLRPFNGANKLNIHFRCQHGMSVALTLATRKPNVPNTKRFSMVALALQITALDKCAHFLPSLPVSNKCRNRVSKRHLVPPADSAKSLNYAKSQLAYSICDGRYKANKPRTSVAPPVSSSFRAFLGYCEKLSSSSR